MFPLAIFTAYRATIHGAALCTSRRLRPARL